MPKQRITKEMVVDAAFEIARREGIEKATVKTISEKLGCSVQPIYSYCQNMDGLRQEVGEKARHFVHEYAAKRMDPQDLFRSTGHAYVQVAKEEPNLFKLYLFQERRDISSLEELYNTETNPAVAEKIAADLSIPVSVAKQLHLNMLIYTIGIGTIYSVTSSSISEEEIYAQQERAYEAFLKNAKESQENEPEDLDHL